MELLLILLIVLLPILALVPLALTAVKFVKDKIRKTAEDISTLIMGVLLTFSRRKEFPVSICLENTATVRKISSDCG